MEGCLVHFNPEVARGSGLSAATGTAGFPNDETFRVGDPSPAVYAARMFFRQHLALGDELEEHKAGANVLGERLPAKRLTLTAGKQCMVDIFDQNAHSHDARTQFYNWVVLAAGGWDCPPANARGYTTAFVGNYRQVLDNPVMYDTSKALTRAYGRRKSGVVPNLRAIAGFRRRRLHASFVERWKDLDVSLLRDRSQPHARCGVRRTCVGQE